MFINVLKMRSVFTPPFNPPDFTSGGLKGGVK